MERIHWSYDAVVEEERMRDSRPRLFDVPKPDELAREVMRGGPADQNEMWTDRLRTIRQINGYEANRRFEGKQGSTLERLALMSIEDTLMTVDLAATYQKIVMYERMHDDVCKDLTSPEHARSVTRGELSVEERRTNFNLAFSQPIGPVLTHLAT